MPNGKRKVFLHPISSDGNNLAWGIPFHFAVALRSEM
jgi:hypothetical protein